MSTDFRYEFRNGALIKIDIYGNEVSPDDSHTSFSNEERSQTFREAHSHDMEHSVASTVDCLRTQQSNDPSDANLPVSNPADGTPSESRMPGMKDFKKAVEKLRERDKQAVAYSKALLVEGDTLVYITYPGESKLYDSTGFEISAAPHRVHSGRLLATGSKFFAKLLSPTSQFRILRRRRMVGQLPQGISYVIDLTPPDEGDEAVELTAELSCSLGVRHWYKTTAGFNIPSCLVAGEDEVIYSRKVASYGSVIAHDLKSTLSQDHEENVTASVWNSYGSHFVNRELEKSTEPSTKEVDTPKDEKDQVTKLEIPEYCPVRHRAGIARLLHVIEGKDPFLDSAPKVWTLFALAKHFDCPATVVDWIVTWLMTDRNTRFIEILPEASCKMAFGLKNQLICRAAFAILVSEEAMSLAAREVHHLEADSHNRNQFGRLREDIDEDLRTRIEYASKNFATRVNREFDVLVDDEMSWLKMLPEFQKLHKFENEITGRVGDNQLAEKWLGVVGRLLHGLRSHIQLQLLATLKQRLRPEQVAFANRNHFFEHYTAVTPEGKKFAAVYDKLKRKERVLTRFFWQIVNDIRFPDWSSSDIKVSPHGSKVRGSGNRSISTISGLRDAQRNFNMSVIEAIQENSFHNGIMPAEAFPGAEIKEVSGTPAGAKNGRGTAIGSNFREINKNWKPFPLSAAKATDPYDPITEKERPEPSIASEVEEPIQPTTTMNWDQDSSEASEKTIAGNTIDLDEHLAKHHLLDPASGLHKAVGPDQSPQDKEKLPGTPTALPLRPRFTPKIAERIKNYLACGRNSQSFGIGSQVSEVDGNGIMTVMTPTGLGTADISSWIAHPSGENDDSAPLLNSAFHAPENEKIFTSEYVKLQPILRPTPAELVPRLPSDFDIGRNSPFFSMLELLSQVEKYISRVATRMLDTHEMGFDIAITDTLLCLGPEEFKYLPLWAGGDDDGTGGVFDDTIPIAIVGPNGPGPSFHTGFSAASAASSDFDTMSDGQTTSFNTSVGVEDGHSDHIDRRVVVADDDFHSEIFTDDSEEYTRKEKGKAVDRDTYSWLGSSLSSGTLSAVGDVPCTGPEFGKEADRDFDMTAGDYESGDMNDENDDADTTIGQFPDNDLDTWDDEDPEEAFDFMDSDDDMVTVWPESIITYLSSQYRKRIG